MANIASFVGQYNEGNGSLPNAPFIPNTAGALGMQEISAILKQIYDGQKLAILYYQHNPLLTMLTKKTDFYGEVYPLPTIVETPTGIANLFPNAQLPNQLINGGSGIAGNLGPAKFVKFMLTRASVYGVHVIDRQAMLSASNNIGAFVNGQMAQMDAMIKGVANLISTQIYRSGSGSIGVISSLGAILGSGTTTNGSAVIATSTITLPNLFSNIVVGMAITGAGIPALATVAAFNAAAGTVTLSANATASATVPFSIASGVITLTNPTDARYFTVGQYMLASSADPLAGTTVTQRAGYGLVVAINRSTGQVTVGNAAAAVPTIPALPSGWIAGDYLAINGTSPLNGPVVAGVQPPVAITGLMAWIGNSQNITPTDVFFGVPRYQDVWRLGGGFYDGSQNGQSVEEALYDGSTQLFMEGGFPTYAFVGPNAYAALQKSCAARNIYETEIEGPQDENGIAHIFFKGIMIQGAGSNFTVLADRSCPPYSAFLLTIEDWALYSLKECPHVVDDDGVSFLRQQSADAFEFRMAGYGQLGCAAPGHSMMVKLSV